MPDPQRMLATLNKAADLSRATPGRSGGLVVLDDSAEDVMVVGDLHGHVAAFAKALRTADLDRNPGRHLVLQELVHGPRRYPDDGGDCSHQLVDLVAALKCKHPDRVHLILGNHELSELTGRSIAKNEVALNALFRQGVETYYRDKADVIHQAYMRLFASLPLAVRTPNRVFLCHTVPDWRDLDHLDPEIYEQDVWPPESLERRGSVYALTWGRDTQPETVDRFAAMLDVDLFVTGHQPCDEGYLKPNHRQIIVDGTDPYPTYCLFPVRGPVTIETLLAGVKRLPMYE